MHGQGPPMVWRQTICRLLNFRIIKLKNQYYNLLTKTVFGEIVPGAFEKNKLFAPGGGLFETLAPVMDDLGVGVVPNLPGGIVGPFAKIDFFEPVKEIFIEQPDIVKKLAADEHIGAFDLLGRLGLFVIKIIRKISIERL
jgi:hypothetical protein